MDLMLDDARIDEMLRTLELTPQQRDALLALKKMPNVYRMQAVFTRDKNAHIEEAEIVSETPRTN